jgi:hypothetical protein
VPSLQAREEVSKRDAALLLQAAEPPHRCFECPSTRRSGQPCTSKKTDGEEKKDILPIDRCTSHIKGIRISVGAHLSYNLGS